MRKAERRGCVSRERRRDDDASDQRGEDCPDVCGSDHYFSVQDGLAGHCLCHCNAGISFEIQSCLAMSVRVNNRLRRASRLLAALFGWWADLFDRFN